MDETVEVPFDDNPSDQATLLLAAAEELDYPIQVVTVMNGDTWVVPADVAELAFSESDTEQESDEE